MTAIADNPYLIFLFALLLQLGAAYFGSYLRKRKRPLKTDERDDFDTVLTATLTLLALVIGFSFSMAVSRYDQRKNYEEAEANAIGTEYLRADLLPGDDAVRVRDLLRTYLRQRIVFYLGGEAEGRTNIDRLKVQSDLWSSVADAGTVQPSPVVALAISGMNDVLNSQGYTEASWLNRIPLPAWGFMILMAIFSNLLLGYRERSKGLLALTILPIIASIAFFLIDGVIGLKLVDS
jgi:hypothetical protein